MNNVTTVANGSFPVVDITHKPKRTQADNLKKAGYTNDEASVADNNVQSKVPQSPTVESAIQFFEDNASGEFKALYSNTAKWLRNYLTLKVKELPKNLQAVLPDSVSLLKLMSCAPYSDSVSLNMWLTLKFP